MIQKRLLPTFDLLDTVESKGPYGAEACFQCRKCSSGCPVSFAMDLFPDDVIRLVILGQRETVLNCRTIWVCASCETCTTRCPNEIRIAELMDCLKEMAANEGISPLPHILALHETFLDSIKRFGRVFEGGLLPEYMLRSGQLKSKLQDGTWKDEMLLGLKLFVKGRFSLLPKRIKGRTEVRRLLESDMDNYIEPDNCKRN